MPKRPTTFLSDRTKAPAREPAFLVGVALHSAPDSWSLASSLDELEALADTAGLAVGGRTTQQLGTPHGGTLIGSGKVEETKLAAHDAGAEVVLFDHELTPRQQRNLESALEVKVIDRTALILDVFAQHARTREGMLQVELAQYEYRLPRLTRMWTHLARQSGGRAGGATGGVGSLAIDMLARLGYEVVALTGKESQADYLKGLGAKEVKLRSSIDLTQIKPLDKATWAGAVDNLGGEMLAWLASTMAIGAPLAAVGLAASMNLNTTVAPFILRGVSLLGVDSVNCLMAQRQAVWQRLATDMRPRHLAQLTRTIPFDDLPRVFDDFIQARVRGRIVVDMAA